MADRMTAELLVDSMSLREQISLLSGEDVWSVNAIPRLGIQKLRVTDGPNGARGGGSLFGGVTAACFPVGIALGATWNRALLAKVGGAIADEVKSKSAHVLLGPTINIQRSVTNGRNFECYSEDPELTAALAVSYIRGLQSAGVAATPKHFIGNESEIERTTVSSDIDERTLREIYLRPFEAAIKEAGTWAIMGSYNKINGTYAAENHWLLTEILRNEWGYDGIVMSDWFGSRTTAPTINAGLDLEMPGPTRDRGDTLLNAVDRGEVPVEQVRQLAVNMVQLMERCGAINDASPFKEIADNRPEHQQLIRRAGIEGSVLLKNTGLLPLSTDLKSIAVIGPNAIEAQIMGGGSSMLNPHYSVSPMQGLTNLLGGDAIHYAQGCTNHRWEPLVNQKIRVDYFANRDLSGEVVFTEEVDESQSFILPPVANGLVDQHAFSLRASVDYTATETGDFNIGLHSAGLAKFYVNGELVINVWDHWQKGRTFFEEGCDEVVASYRFEAGKTYTLEMEFATKDTDNLDLAAWRFGLSKPLGDEAIQAAVELAKSAEVAILFVGRSGQWDTEGSDLEGIKLPGRQDELVAAVASANPNTLVVLQTGGPVEMPWVDQVSGILQAWYPGQECGNAIADVLFGKQDPSGRLPQTFPVKLEDNPTYTDDPLVYPGRDGHVLYREGVFIGYRHYQANKIEPLFPFGFGLSYSDYQLENLSCRKVANDYVELKVSVNNIGQRQGQTVVQIYCGEVNSDIERPELELADFEKLELKAGESADLTFHLPLRRFAYFDIKTGMWTVAEGDYRVRASFHAKDPGCEAVINLSAKTLCPSA
ncbi:MULTISPECIES: glycoside hydrolase family 3 protein [unclassified Marinobacterium]|uniref:beta-glucosidase n=1 Tax=unclassified Marinobacterium TaxID=2644139 RepID=UPI001A024F77|nr:MULTISPECIES: glycoside hydrolase family 3 C-terminal domain-containing protein [unclassified Marinobacterium]NRP58086.1 Thermostable beta-glucosidase B [Marinobacterium sp. xm-d-510]NRP98317.1 Thermostable beta-glucosidase B [Marinobacterium sp. xm-a-127]